MKLIILINSQSALSKLITLDLDIKKAYALRKFIIEVNSKLQAYEQIREDLIKKLGEEKDGNFTVKQENIEKFYKDINKIGEEEIEIEIPEISIDDMEGKIDTDTLIKLYYLIK